MFCDNNVVKEVIAVWRIRSVRGGISCATLDRNCTFSGIPILKALCTILNTKRSVSEKHEVYRRVECPAALCLVDDFEHGPLTLMYTGRVCLLC